MKSHTLDSFIQGFSKSSSITYLNDSKSFKVKTCHDQRHLKGSLTGKNKLWIQNSESTLNIAFRIVFKNKLSFGSSAQVTEKHGYFFFFFLSPWLCHKSNSSLRATFLILLVQLTRAGEYFYFPYMKRDNELRRPPINSIFSPSSVGKEKFMAIRDLGAFRSTGFQRDVFKN